MKHALLTLRWLSAACFTIAFSGCLKDNITRTYTIYRPIFKAKAEVLANVKSNAPQSINEKGKIFLYGNYLFVNEVNKGVHVINNSNPAAPVREAFIDIPGNIDVAVKGNTLYADMYCDLLAIDIANPLQARLKKVVENVFPERFYSNGISVNPTSVIIGWETRDTTVKIEDATALQNCTRCNVMLQYSNSAAPPAATVPGLAGSMARFSLVNDYLYAVNTFSLNVLNIANPNSPALVTNTSIGANIETIYPFKDKLFIGSNAGMFIYDITNPALPVRQGQFTHARACDPVVADNDFAYVTLRSGTRCDGTNNQLDVINVQNVLAPTLSKTYPLTNPHGLAKEGRLLFVCDGSDGLKVFDAATADNLKLVSHIKNLDAYDAIAWNNHLVVIASDGLYQYSYTNGTDLALLSKITITK